MNPESLIYRPDLRVPIDLNEGSEPECNEEGVWQVPEHNLPNGERCVGSSGLVYNVGLTSENPPHAPCGICGHPF